MCGDFTLELFARGLPSEDADENAQPVIAATMRDASWCSVSSLAADCASVETES